MNQVNITRRVNVEGKGPRFCKVIRGNSGGIGRGKIRPDVVLVDGREYANPRVACITLIFSRMGSGRAGLQARPLPKL